MYVVGSGKTCTVWYIPVRQLTGRYRAIPLRSAIGGRFRLSTVDFHRRWLVSAVCGQFKEKSTVGGRLRKKKERRRGKEEEEEEEKYLAATPPGGRPRAVAARAALARRQRVFFSPREEEKYLAATPSGGCPRAVAARAALAPLPPAGFFLPTQGDETSPHAGESSRRRKHLTLLR
ncbi:hypothetical protein BHE74_00018704 [Ensete ventricosum]|nr:hypothetical protein BHE74_00018704 [Ensete ventricosum]RZR99520.1 hypothetical protein BHM03_00029079 [Ensete ventricosum]